MERTDYDLEAVKRELKPLISGGSYENIYQLLYNVTLLKYSTQGHLKSIGFSGAEKVVTKKKLQVLSELGYVRLANEMLGIYTCTAKTLQLLQAVGHDLNLLPAVPKGTGAEIYNTDVFVQALKLPNYYTLLFPQFPKEAPYIIPDALLILKEERRYQLNFLEIEAEKPNLERHLQTKYEGYKRLAKDIQAYYYWKVYSGYLKLPCPPVEEFKFRVMIIGSMTKDWGKGFEFRSEL
ncbi:MAG: hypothetical protein Q8N56_01075 [bacterium]|nr:hypothetical protein [bacterium]